MVNSDGSYKQVDMSSTSHSYKPCTLSCVDETSHSARVLEQQEGISSGVIVYSEAVKPKIFKCDLCNAVFNSSSNCKRHRMIHNVNTEVSHIMKDI